jgi:hypothetical protein
VSITIKSIRADGDELAARRTANRWVFAMSVCYVVGLLVGRPGSLGLTQRRDGISLETLWTWVDD